MHQRKFHGSSSVRVNKLDDAETSKRLLAEDSLVTEESLSVEEIMVFKKLKTQMETKSENSTQNMYFPTSIEGYATGVYVVNSKRLWHSIFVLPQITLLWKPTNFEEITVESLSILKVFQPKIGEPNHCIVIFVDAFD
jgi:hypothetical protein